MKTNGAALNTGSESSDVDLVGDTTFEGDEYKTPAGLINVEQDAERSCSGCYKKR